MFIRTSPKIRAEREAARKNEQGIMENIIKRIDLGRDFRRHRDEYMAAIEAVCDVTAYSGGSFVEKFEGHFAEYCGTKHAIGVNNGTSALHCAMAALGVGEGDEVIVPANTFIATAWGVSYTGATPVFADCTADTWEISPESVEKLITPRTKGIVGVHLYGQPFEYDSIRRIADEHGLFVAEDCAQAHGALYNGRKVGSLGEIGCFSFYPGKNLYCFGEGGCVTTDNDEYYEYMKMFKEHGSRERYHHDMIGYNMRLEGIQGAVLDVSLGYLDGWTKRRRELSHRYLESIHNPAITMQAHPDNTTPVFHLFVVEVDDRECFMQYMKDRGILCDIHYPIPCHLQKAYANLGYKPGDCPNAEYLAAHCVSLPMFPELTDEEAERVIAACNEYKGKGKAC